ncbi:macrolide family glycosyltransferase [Streptomyces sp. NRRL F-2664]|uniref:macrolide family glycosyltransferase n=1 Tax=Streptomyces sp. NRRL F-2664 TaxID=1463842 RepID=UPI0004CBCACD|nr:macrolide family glycosyltransferase [Streptomyces sp. NRRL F-2664]
MPLHVGFVGIAWHGHVNPTLGLVEELVRRGHRVSYAVTEAFAETVRAVGAEPVVYRNPVDDALTDDGLDISPTDFLREAEAALPVLAEAWAEDRPDLIAYDGIAWAGRVLAARWHLPAAEMWPSFVSNEHFSLEAEFLADQPLHPGVLRFVRELTRFLTAHGLPATSAADFLGHTEPLRLVFLPRSFQYRGETFDDRFAFVGPCAGERGFQGGWSPAADHRPVLLIALGTACYDWPDFFRMCAEAVADLPWQVVMAYGPGLDPADFGPLPDHVDARPHFPQLAVLRHADAFVTHGGMGSTMEALLHGTPMVAVPQTHEQTAVAERIDRLGLGVRLDRDRLTAQTLREALLRVMGDPGIRANAARMRTELRSAGAAPEAADRLERLAASAAPAAAHT